MEEKPTQKSFSLENYELCYKIYNEKIEYYSYAIDKLSKVKVILEKFLKEKWELIKLKTDYSFEPLSDDDYLKLISILKEQMIVYFKRCLVIISDLIKNITNIRETTKINIKNYSDYFTIHNTFNTQLEELNNCQTKYYNSAQKAESLTYKILEKKISGKETDQDSFETKNKLLTDCKEDKEKYISKLPEINEQISLINEKEQILFNSNKNIEICRNENYLNSLTYFFDFINKGIEGNDFKKEIKNLIIKITNYREDLETFKYKPKEKVDFIQYKSKIDFNGIYDTMEMGIYLSVSQEMKNAIGEYNEENLKQCKEKIEINGKIKSLFNSKKKISEKDEEKILTYLDLENGRSIFLKYLTQLRTKGSPEKSKQFVDFVGKALNKILDYEKDHNEFTHIKSCILLSQTFYCLDENKNKIYIFIHIKHHTWLKTPKFWRVFIANELDTEMNKNNITNRHKRDIVFTQLVTYCQNIKEFNIDDRIIVKIMDEFLKKYDYIDKNKSMPIYTFINDNMDEIEKLRKEYQDNPDLEEQLYPEDTKDNNKVDKND